MYKMRLFVFCFLFFIGHEVFSYQCERSDTSIFFDFEYAINIPKSLSLVSFGNNENGLDKIAVARFYRLDDVNHIRALIYSHSVKDITWNNYSKHQVTKRYFVEGQYDIEVKDIEVKGVYNGDVASTIIVIQTKNSQVALIGEDARPMSKCILDDIISQAKQE